MHEITLELSLIQYWRDTIKETLSTIHFQEFDSGGLSDAEDELKLVLESMEKIL